MELAITNRRTTARTAGTMAADKSSARQTSCPVDALQQHRPLRRGQHRPAPLPAPSFSCRGLVGGRARLGAGFDLRLMDQSIRALGSVKAVADGSCTNSTRMAAVPRAIAITAKHATMKTRMIFLQPPWQIQRTCPEAGSVKALVSISTKVRPSAPTRA